MGWSINIPVTSAVPYADRILNFHLSNELLNLAEVLILTSAVNIRCSYVSLKPWYFAVSRLIREKKIFITVLKRRFYLRASMACLMCFLVTTLLRTKSCICNTLAYNV